MPSGGSAVAASSSSSAAAIAFVAVAALLLLQPSAAAAGNAADPLGEALLQRVRSLAAYGAVENGPGNPPGVDRGYLAEAAAGARGKVAAWMEEAGLRVAVDGAGNVVGEMRCGKEEKEEEGEKDREGRAFVLLGSHHDTVRNGGWWDGAYGVLAGLAVAEVIKEREGGICAMPFDLRVVSFDDEEGNSAFGTTNTGAKAYVGLLDVEADLPTSAAKRNALVNAYRAFSGGNVGWEGVVAALKAVGDRFDKDRVIAALELHIEQGPVLINKGASVGVVSAIAGQTRMEMTFKGAAGHAGTVPMALRRDALVVAAAVVAEVERLALAAGEGAVATVGRMAVEPGGTNVVPGRVVMSLDVRAPADAVREGIVRAVLAFSEKMSAAKGVNFEFVRTHQIPAVEMAPWLREAAVQAISGMRVGELGKEMEGEKTCGREEGKDSNRECDGSGAAGGCAQERGGANQSVCRLDVDVSPHGPQRAGSRGAREPVVVLPSGAGHDSQLMAKVTSAGMIFVRCRDGISHSPLEHVDDADARAGAEALLRTVDAIAEREWKRQKD